MRKAARVSPCGLLFASDLIIAIRASKHITVFEDLCGLF
jgi:hypothetical protein